MKSILLIIGGVIQVLILALHIAIYFGIASAESMGADMKVTAHIFNAAVTITVLFFAYVSLLPEARFAWHTPWSDCYLVYCSVLSPTRTR